MKLLKNKESGQVLLMALILLAAGSLLVIPLLKQSFTNVEYHQSIECRTLNNYTAGSGVEYVLCKLYGNPGVYTDPTNPLRDNFTLNNRTVDVKADYLGDGLFLVTSTASGGGCGSTTITAHINLGAGSFAYVIAAKNDISLVGNVTIDSDDPDPETGHGDIRCNGNIVISGNVTVDGSASAVGTIRDEDELPIAEGVVTGVVWEDASKILFPGDYSGLYETMSKEKDDIQVGDLVIRENRTLGPVHITGSLTVEPTTIVTLTGTVYVIGTIEVNNARFEGQQNVVATGTITISGGGIGAENIPLFTSVNGDITLQGTVVDAVVYAPNGNVDVSNVDYLYGAVGGDTVTVSNATVIYAQSLQGRDDLPGGLLYTISYSYD